MASYRIPEPIKRVFTESFVARDIAEPLASFDAAVPSAEVRAFMQARDYDVIGIRVEGQVVGFVEVGGLLEGPCGALRRALDEVPVVEDAAPLLSVLTKLTEAPFAFVMAFGSVAGIITHADLQKPPVRMWLFGILTLIEMRFTNLIQQSCSEEVWKKYLSPARLQKGLALLEERGRRNQSLRLLDCLQFADKGQIIARHEDLRKRTVFPSRNQAEEATKRLEALRNNLAHAQDILTTDWGIIIQLCEFIAGR
jgi:hypothetical protein